MQPETAVEKAILENGVGLFAICYEKEGSFEYWIAGLYKGGQVPEGLKLYTFPESDWAQFSAKGPLPGSLQELNTQVWQEWYPNEGQKYRGNGNAMLEFEAPGHWKTAVRGHAARQVFTVNSSPYAEEVYQYLGFTQTDREQNVDGLRFTPMQYDGERI